MSFSFQQHYLDAQQTKVKEQIDDLIEKLKQRYDIPVHAITRIGRPHLEITSYAKTIDASLVVVGAHGEHSFLDNLLGSTSSRVCRSSPCPVLIVKSKQSLMTPYQQVVAAVDFSPASSQVAELAQSFAPGAHIEALLVFDADQEAHIHKAGMNDEMLKQYRTQAMEHASQRLTDVTGNPKLGKNISHKILPGYPPIIICKHAEELHADLIAIGKREKYNLEDWLLGSVSKGVVYAAKCDVLLAN